MKNTRYLLLLIIGLVLLSASFSIEAIKTKASPGSCVSGDTCYFFVEWDWCTTGSNCNIGCNMYSYRCCHKQTGTCIYNDLSGYLAYCDDFCRGGLQ